MNSISILKEIDKYIVKDLIIVNLEIYNTNFQGYIFIRNNICE